MNKVLLYATIAVTFLSVFVGGVEESTAVSKAGQESGILCVIHAPADLAAKQGDPSGSLEIHVVAPTCQKDDMKPVFYLVPSSKFQDPNGGLISIPPHGNAPAIVQNLRPGSYHIGVGVPFPVKKSDGLVSMLVPDVDIISGQAYDGWVASSGAIVQGWLYTVRWYPVQVRIKKTALVSVVMLKCDDDINARLLDQAPQEDRYTAALSADQTNPILGIKLCEVPKLLARAGKFFEKCGQSTGRVWFLLDTTSGAVSGHQRYMSESGEYKIAPIIILGSTVISSTQVAVDFPKEGNPRQKAPITSPSNKLTLINLSGQRALVKLTGPTNASIEVPSGQTESLALSVGDYFIWIRYGTEGNYRYEKGEKFRVIQTADTVSHVSITLHKVLGGNYSTHPIAAEEFGE